MEAESNQNAVEEPAVVGWYRTYCALLVVLIGVVAPLLLWAAATSSPFPSGADFGGMPAVNQMLEERENERKAAAVLPILLCIGMAALPVIALTLKPTPGAWVYHILILCLGLSGCTLPFAVIMLIVWFQPPTQAYFGRGPARSSSP
jgi:hypothetical protein